MAPKKSKSSYEDLLSRSASSMSSEAFAAQQPFLVRGCFASLAVSGLGPFSAVCALDGDVLQDFYRIVLLPRLLEVAMTCVMSTELTARPMAMALAQAVRSMCTNDIKVDEISGTSSSSVSEPPHRGSDSSTEDLCVRHEDGEVTGTGSRSSIDLAFMKRKKKNEGEGEWVVKVVLEAKTDLDTAGQAEWKNKGQYQLLKYVIDAITYNKKADYEGMVVGFGTDLKLFHLATMRVTGRVWIGEDGRAEQRPGSEPVCDNTIQAALKKVRDINDCHAVTQLKQGEYLLGNYFITKEPFKFLPLPLPVPPRVPSASTIGIASEGLFGIGILLRACVGKALHKWVPGDEGTVKEKLEAWEDKVEQLRAKCKPLVSTAEWKEVVANYLLKA